MAQTSIIGDESISALIMNERSFGWDTAFPATWPVDGFFLRTDTKKMFQNTGTEGIPVFTAVLGGAGALAQDENVVTGAGEGAGGVELQSVRFHTLNLGTAYVIVASVTLTPDTAVNFVYLWGCAVFTREDSTSPVFAARIREGAVDKVSEQTTTISINQRCKDLTINDVLVDVSAVAHTYDLQVKEDRVDSHFCSGGVGGFVVKLA